MNGSFSVEAGHVNRRNGNRTLKDSMGIKNCTSDRVKW